VGCWLSPPILALRLRLCQTKENPTRTRKVSVVLALLSALFALAALFTSQPAAAQTEKVLRSFPQNLYPGGLIADSAGNLYGITVAAGNSCSGSDCGTVFELSPAAGGGYTEKILYSAFSRYNTNGWNPAAGVALDAAGNLYGTTSAGGTYGNGVLFKLTKSGSSYTETVLHSFGGDGDGAQPLSVPVVAGAGNIYGTTLEGGAHADGTVFELSPKAGGGYTYKLIHSFNGNDGALPYGNLVRDAAGNLYGITTISNTSNGTAFELSPGTGGTWTENVFFYFTVAPSAGLTADGAGNFFGTTGYGGVNNAGSVFQLTLASGVWTQQTICSFCSESGCADGDGPVGVVLDSTGNLYGSTYAGGAYSLGTACKLSPATGGAWTYNGLHTFGNGADGANPLGVVLGPGGKLYGVTFYGGAYGYGTVFEINP